ncbi:glycosyltransferase [Bacillus sp. UNCCL81]|uniref:glycosyltransferase n=1 Tax=Bacillus sp. UNCCL81 TaxID=1502755 RepID=UPI0008E079EF|nr:glycosyltransferase [Bacillus sp. UNCCL81]SFD10016.1 Glycosyltransferase involved in cell wall bisynthesis [Bacillus sp. UNCCL81]
MKVCYSPYNEEAMDQNKYIYQVTKSMEKSGFEVLSVRETIKNIKNFKEVKVFNLNWYENIYDKNSIKAYIHYLFKLCFLFFLKIFNKKIIWTVHNKIPHNTNNEKLSKKMMIKLANLSNIIITHCEDTNLELTNLTGNNKLLNKVRKVNHPNYIGLYNQPNVNLRDYYNISTSDIVFLFLGQIKPYKNIELIIKAASEFKVNNIKFIIAGKCVSKEYEDKLQRLIRGNESIIPIFRFIENEEIPNFLYASDVVLLPYDINSSLNSGAAILAFSLGKTVICPRIGTLNEVNSYENMYSYIYQDENDHINKIIGQIKKILNYQKPKEVLFDKGNNLLKIMEREYSINKISADYNLIFSQFYEKKE